MKRYKIVKISEQLKDYIRLTVERDFGIGNSTPRGIYLVFRRYNQMRGRK